MAGKVIYLNCLDLDVSRGKGFKFIERILDRYVGPGSLII